MGAVVLADPGVEARAIGRRRYAVPLVLVAGWGGLFAYSAAYLTEDMPFRPQRGDLAQRTEGETAPLDAAPRRVLVVAAPEANAVPREEPRPVAAPAAPVADPPAATPAAPARPVQGTVAASQAPVNAEYVGVWGPTADACGVRSRRRGYIPATITPERAKAGRTICSFHDGRRVGNAWVMGAECSDRGRHWSSQVRLVVDGDRLTWSSSRGTSAYVRCGRRPG